MNMGYITLACILINNVVSKPPGELTKTLGLTGFPKWFGSEDQKFLLGCDWLPNVTVAKDGSGDYLTIGEALAKVPGRRSPYYVIHVKAGIYYENVVVWPDQIAMFGDGKSKTVVSGDLSKDGYKRKTFQTATFSVRGNGFVIRDMRFRNTAGPEKYQAVAFHSRSSKSVMYRCTFDGFQDTLYAQVGEQLYRECDIRGTVDFIFGAAAAVFQRCNIQPRKPLPKQVNTITAQGATDQKLKTGFSIIGSTILPYEEGTFKTYLGRPWKAFSTVVVMKSFIGELVDPEGWLPWNNEPPPTTLAYGEYRNYGPGSGIGNRVNWIGYKPIMTDQEADTYSIDGLINQSGWLNQTCIS